MNENYKIIFWLVVLFGSQLHSKMSLVSPLFLFLLCQWKIIFLALSLQKLGRNSVCSFYWCYLITRMRNKSDGISYRWCSMATFYFVPYNLLAIEKSTTNQTPQKTDCELKKLVYLGSGLSITITYPANTRFLFKLSHFCRTGSLKPMDESRISYRSAKGPCRKENTTKQKEEMWVRNLTYLMYLRTILMEEN